MHPTLTSFEWLTILGLVAYFCAPSLKKLFDPEIQRARERVSRRDAAGSNDRQATETPGETTPCQLETQAATAVGAASREELRITITRSCADALLATLRGDLEGETQTARSIDSKLAEALRPGCRTIRLEVDPSSDPKGLIFANECTPTGQRMFVVQSAAAGKVRVSSPWEYMSEPDSAHSRKTPATIWSAHSNFLGFRPPTSPSSVKEGVAGTPRPLPPRLVAKRA